MPLRLRFLRSLLAAGLVLSVGGACKKDVKKNYNGPDPDTNSGPEAKRGGAKPMEINKPETDSVSWPKLLRTKWKRLEIANNGVQPILDCELRIDNTGADLNIDVFNSLGTQIGFTPGPAPNKLKKLAVQIDELGTYFVRVQAAQPKDESDFSVICKWDELQQTAEAPKPVRHGKRPPKPDAPVKEETLEEKAEKGTEGRVVTAFRDGDKMQLLIDKGAAAGVRVGTEGTVLQGKSGRQPLDGATFRVTKVLDDGKCQGETGARSLGKGNNRIVLFLK